MANLFVFEGPDKVGKTTGMSKVSRELHARNIAHRIRSIWDSELGGMIKGEILDPSLPNMTKALLVAGVRYAYYVEHVMPLLDKGVVVLMDRWTLSTMAYQGEIGSRPSEFDISMLHQSMFASLGDGYAISFPPTCFVMVDREVAEDRFLKAGSSLDNLESSLEIQDKVWKFYSQYPASYRAHCDTQVCGSGELNVKMLLATWLLPQLSIGQQLTAELRGKSEGR